MVTDRRGGTYTDRQTERQAVAERHPHTRKRQTGRNIAQQVREAVLCVSFFYAHFFTLFHHFRIFLF